MRPVDAHVHLPSYQEPRSILRAAASTGTFLLSCTVSPSEAALNLELRKEWPANLACFVGVHPSDVRDVLPSRSLASYLESADGIGEVGLDEKYSATSPGSDQMRAFVDQLSCAERLGKPIQVHSRGSAQLCLDVMGSFRLKSVLMHWLEDEGALGRVISRGYYLSVGPAVLYSKKVRRIAIAAPPDRLLTETDGPVAYSALGGASGPALIPSVVFAVSELQRSSYEDTLLQVLTNAGSYLARKINPAQEA